MPASGFPPPLKDLLGTSMAPPQVAVQPTGGQGVALNPKGQLPDQFSYQIQNNGTLVGARRKLNVTAGANVTLSFADDQTNDRVNVSIAASSVTLPKVVTGIIPAAGTTPTAGTGFSYTHTNASGVYAFTFTVSFAATPVVLASVSALVAGTPSWAIVDSATVNGFTVETFNVSNVASDRAFDFLAYQVS